VNIAPFARRDVDGLAVVGLTNFDLRGIRFEETDEGNTGDAVIEPGTVDSTTDSTTNPESDGKPEVFDRAYVEQLRQEAAKLRTSRDSAAKEAAEKAAEEARQALTRELGKALGYEKDEADPAKLLEAAQKDREAALQERDTTQAQLKTLLRENAVTKAASLHGANAGALSDSVTFQAKAAAIDPTADDFADQVSALVKQAVESDPKFKAVQVAATTGSASTTHSGDTAADKPITRDELAKLYKQPGGQKKILQLQREGKLQHLVS